MFTDNKLLNKRLCFWVLLVSLLLPLTSDAAMTINFNVMMNALKSNAGPIIRFAVATAYVIGFWFIISAIMELKKVGQSSSMQSQPGAISAPIVKFVIGILLMYLPTTIDISVWTLWGHTAMGEEGASYMAYTPAGGDPFGQVKAGAIAIVRVVGYISLIRGLIMLSRTSQQSSQPGSFGKGFIHVIGGILAINIVETIRVIESTLGFVAI